MAAPIEQMEYDKIPNKKQNLMYVAIVCLKGKNIPIN